ncbi:50S ribosomal protein L4 [bacterium]|nr:50S ribosomal protein L4 [bacterium]
MKLPAYNQNGEKIEEIELPDEIFNVRFNPDLVHQVVVSQMANRRKVIAHTKDRGEVSGGGRKPWRQKGLGRARHGSIRSPLWRHGGITFGPRKEKVFKKKIPKKMKRKALFMVLSEKARNNCLILLDNLNIKEPKTKLAREVLKKLSINNQSALVALPSVDKNLILSLNNLPNVQSIQAKDITALDLLSFKYLIMLKDSIKVIKETFL